MIKYTVRVPFYIDYQGYRCFVDYNAKEQIIINVTDSVYIKKNINNSSIINKVYYYLQAEGFIEDSDELE